MTDQLYRFEELLALHLADREQMKGHPLQQERVTLAIDGLPPDVGHEVLWVLREYAPCPPQRLPSSRKTLEISDQARNG